MKFRALLLCFTLLTCNILLFAQVEEDVRGKDDEKENFGSHLVFGGDIGLSFGTITYIKVAPVVGYRVGERLTPGLGPIYIYESYKFYDLRTSTYGGKAVLSFIVIKAREDSRVLGVGDIVLHAENEVINIEPLYLDPNVGYNLGERAWIDNLLLGGGLSQHISENFGVSIFLLWDVTNNRYSPYTNPIFKFGFYF